MPEGVIQNTSPLPDGRHTLVKPIQYGQEEMEIVLVELISLHGKGNAKLQRAYELGQNV